MLRPSRVCVLLVLGLVPVALTLAPGCGDGDNPSAAGPYDDLAPKTTITAPGLSAPIDVVRDAYGIPHVYAQSEADAAFANGYVVAADRLLQLQLMRHFAKGKVAKLFGALDPGQIDSDLEMRMHRIGPRADVMVATLAASTDPDDRATTTYLRRYADGVNFYLGELVSGKHTLDPAVAVFLDAERFEAWDPSDSVAIGLLQAWSLSYFTDELGLTRAFERSRQVFDHATPGSALAARTGAVLDLLPFEPVWKASTIDGWPNLPTDGGTRAKPAPSAAGPHLRPRRPSVPIGLLDAAAATLAPKQLGGVPWRSRLDGSNNWVVGPTLAGGKVLLANDPHLSLSNPPIMHAIHITVVGGVDMQGVSLAGLPGLVIGHNQHLAWGATTAYHDVTDFYLEDIKPCSAGGGDCAVEGGVEKKLETWTETIEVGASGTVTSSFTVTYERVPGRGPIIPTIDATTHRLVKRTGSKAIAVRFTGYDDTVELRALYRLSHASSVAEGFTALDAFRHGAQSWVLADDQGHFGWTSTARLPRRSPGCFGFDRESARDGTAPFFVLPSDGSCEWTGDMDPRYVPHAIDPAKGFLATANHDLVGESFDGDLLNGPLVDGAPLYAGGPYPYGSRQGRITTRLQGLKDAGRVVTLDDLASIQADSHSSFGERLRPPIAQAVARFAAEIQTPGAAPELSAYVGGLTSERRQAMLAAAERLAAWSLATPAGASASASADEVRDATATTIFNIWLVEFFDLAFGDELELLQMGPEYHFTVAAAINVLTAPASLVTGKAAATGEALLCDDLSTAATTESCTLLVLRALERTTSKGTELFGSAQQDDWRWGRVHRLTLRSLAPSAELDLPAMDDPDPLLAGGYPRPGDGGGIDAATPGAVNFDFTYGHGPCMRLLVEMTQGEGPLTRFALPGGNVLDRASPFFRNLMDEYWVRNLTFELPWTTAQIKAQAVTRTVFRP
jgi:penicillin amidase